MQAIVLLAALVAATQAFIVCPPNFCDEVKQPLLDCQGGILKNSGFCGCTHSCAKVEGEACRHNNVYLLGVPNTEQCDEGLICQQVYLEGAKGNAICVNATNADLMVSKKRSVPKCETPCQRKSLQCTFSLVVYQGQWFAKCDMDGNFLSKQCNNINECFCVDENGTIDESTRMLGSSLTC